MFVKFEKKSPIAMMNPLCVTVDYLVVLISVTQRENSCHK